MLGNHGGIGGVAIGGVVAVIAVMVGLKAFVSVNDTFTAAQLSATGGLMDLTPLLLAALAVIAIVGSFILLVR